MATANENTTAPEASVVEDDRSIRDEDRPTLEREDLAEDQSISGDDRSMRVHDRSMLEVVNQLVYARDRPMVGDRSVFRRKGLPVVLGDTFLEIHN